MEKEIKEEIFEENVKTAYTQVKATRKRSKIIIALCIIICLLITGAAELFIYKQNHRTTLVPIVVNNRERILYTVEDYLSRNGYLDRDTVCTDLDINLPRDEEKTAISGSMRFYCPLFHKSIEVLITPSPEQVIELTFLCTTSDESTDGIAAQVLFDYLGAVDVNYFLENFAHSKSSDYINVSIFPTIYWTFYSAQPSQFGGNQHYFDGEKINRVYSSEGMFGKHYESVITAGRETESCCSVYIPR